MRVEEIKQTAIWDLYEKGRNFHRLMGVYADTDMNYRMYNGNQWLGVKTGDVEPVQKNFIKPIVRYKVGVVHDNLYAIVYTSLNFENKEFRKQADKICEMLNKRASRVWERDKMDLKGRKITKDSAINDEGIIYVDFDQKTQDPKNEIVKKNDIYYGNENDEEIQDQPYILVRKRLPVSKVVEIALEEGISEEETKKIIGDNDTFEESGEAAKQEVDGMCTLITKMYKKDGTVHFAKATRYLEIKKETDSGLTYYPVAHMNWEEKEGSARGEGEVRYLIPAQKETNRTEMRRILTVKLQAYPTKVVDTSKVQNPNALNQVGGIIKTNGQPVEDVHKIIGTLAPAQMSPDVKQLQEDLIQVTRELAGAGDVATGQVNPEDASGKAILAVQQASQSPMTEQKEAYKNFVEDLARIWLDMWTVYSQEGIKLEETVQDPMTGEEVTQLIDIPQTSLQELQASVKVEITPKGAYDRYAQELTLENLLKGGYFSPELIGQTKAWAESLPDDAVAPKQTILDTCDKIIEEQQRIAEMKAQAQLMEQQAMQFLNGDPDSQSEQILEAEQQIPVEEEVPVEIPVE